MFDLLLCYQQIVSQTEGVGQCLALGPARRLEVNRRDAPTAYREAFDVLAPWSSTKLPNQIHSANHSVLKNVDRVMLELCV